MRKKKGTLCQAQGCARPHGARSTFCGYHAPEHLALLQAGQARWKAAECPPPASPRRKKAEAADARLRIKPEGICFYRSARRMRSLKNLTEDERHEVVPPCGRPADGGVDICRHHVKIRAKQAEVARLEQDAVPQPPAPSLERLMALQRVTGWRLGREPETAEEYVLEQEWQAEARAARDRAAGILEAPPPALPPPRPKRALRVVEALLRERERKELAKG